MRFSARSALRAGYWPTCLTDGHMVVNDHTRSAENWKCVWYFLHPIDGSNGCAKRRYTPINVAASQCFEWTEWGACRADCGVYYCCFQCCSFILFRMDQVGACRADCGVYYCCFQCSSFAVLRIDRVYNIRLQNVNGGHSGTLAFYFCHFWGACRQVTRACRQDYFLRSIFNYTEKS